MEKDWKHIEKEMLNLCIVLWERAYDIVNEIDEYVIIQSQDEQFPDMKLDKDNVMYLKNHDGSWMRFSSFEEAKCWNDIPNNEIKNVKLFLSNISRFIAIHRYQKEVIINSVSFLKRQDKEKFYKFLITEKNEYFR